MAVTNASPSTVSGANPSSSNQIGSGSGNLFKINMYSFDFDAWTPRFDSSGDGDTSPVMINNGWVYFRVVIRGAMVASQAIGLQNLGASSPLSAVSLLLTSNRKIIANLMVERVRGRWRKPRDIGETAIIPVSITAWATETAKASLEASVS